MHTGWPIFSQVIKCESVKDHYDGPPCMHLHDCETDKQGRCSVHAHRLVLNNNNNKLRFVFQTKLLHSKVSLLLLIIT
jgi:peptide methionine sulfoxide reductase MsrB